ncbi:MAG TPA: transcription repressor NadR [Lachnospiraceae bacterium]|nr:transcription repressor NadR [Lachnospiraceae bacterium]
MITEGVKRREHIIEFLSMQVTPVSGTELAKQFGVSRQVIVQDIALLRAENRDILSTNKGYLLFKPQTKSHLVIDVIFEKHNGSQILDEMASIVELGGKMLDVSIDHDLYGQIRCDLVINNMEDANDFMNKIKESASKPLSVLTDDFHYHTISAPSQKAMDLIKTDLREKGYLVE